LELLRIHEIKQSILLKKRQVVERAIIHDKAD